MVKQAVSIIHVAERAGVSIATASRVMSNSSYPVSAATRQKVLAAAAELGYAPNSLARGLRSQRSKLLAVMVGDNADPYFAGITRGVEEIAKEHGYLTIVCNTNRDPAREISYLQTLRDYRTDGIIFAGGAINDPHHSEHMARMVAEMRERGAAFVTLSQHTLRVPSVQADNFGGARAMTERLLQLGHREIAFVTGPVNLTVANVRLQGYIAALTQYGLSVNPDLIIPGNFDQAGGERAAQYIVQMPAEKRPTAIFAANDETAFGLMLGLAHQGWSIPRDISICGFGDLPMAQLLSPALTTVQVPLLDLGRNGALRLFALLGQETVSDLEILPTQLVERASTRALL